MKPVLTFAAAARLEIAAILRDWIRSHRIREELDVKEREEGEGKSNTKSKTSQMGNIQRPNTGRLLGRPSECFIDSWTSASQEAEQ